MAPPRPPPGRQELAAVVRFHLVPTNETLKLAERAPQLGASWTSPTEQPSHRRSRRSDSDSASPSVLPTVLPWQEFTDSDWRPLQHVLIHALARHPARSGQSEAQFCIVAAPPQPGLYPKGHAERRAGGTSAGNNGGCGSVGNRWSDWIALCPALPIIVIDTVDADYRAFKLCTAFWKRGRCLREQTTALLRVVGSPPLTKHPGEKPDSQRSRLAPCPALSVPWLSHARASIPLPLSSSRSVRIAAAFSTVQHGTAILLGFGDWRLDLHDACYTLQNRSLCTHLYQPMSGKNARAAVDLYARSVFCLQPPGDVVTRGAIVDAISVGCIPVFFHPAQPILWPLHWNGARSSVFFDWTDPRQRNQNRTTLGLASLDKPAAHSVLRRLIEMSDAEVVKLQRAVARAASRMYYRLRPGGDVTNTLQTVPVINTASPTVAPDAVDILVAGLSRELYSRRHAANLSWPTVARRLRLEMLS